MNFNKEFIVDRRQTKQRSLVLDSVIKLHNHPTAQEVYDYVHGVYPGIGKATVYRNLNLLADEGKLKRVEAISGPVHFDSTLCEHSHLECKICKKVIDVEFPISEELYENIESTTGFTCIDRSLVINGICPTCLNTKDL